MRRRQMVCSVVFTLAGLAAGCSSDSTAPAADLSGGWTISAATVTTSAGYGCSNTIMLQLQQAGSRLDGSYTLTGTCTTPHDVRTDAHSGAVTSGSIGGNDIRFDLGICRFDGNPDSDDALSGTVMCSQPAEIPLSFTGTWNGQRNGS
jgi:hypothetical protein